MKMHKILLAICLIVGFNSNTNAENNKTEYPEKGLIHYFDLNGNLKDRITGKKLSYMLPESYADRKPEYIKDNEGNTFGIRTFPLLLNGNYSLEKYPEISVVIRFRQDKEYDSHLSFTYFAAGKYRYNDIGWSFDEQYSFNLNKNNHPFIYTEGYKTEKETEDGTETVKIKGVDGYLDRAELGKWNTMVFTVSSKDSTISLSSNGIKVMLDKFFPTNTDKECNGIGLFNYSFYDKDDYRYPDGVIDDILIYSRILTDEETSKLQGVDSIEYRNPELTLMENIRDSAFFLFILLICPVVSLIFCIFRPGQLPDVKIENPNGNLTDRLTEIDNERDIKALNLAYNALRQIMRMDISKVKITSPDDPELVSLIEKTEVAPERITFFRAFSVRRKLKKAQKNLDNNEGVRFIISEITSVYNKAMKITFVGNYAVLLIPFLLYFLPNLTLGNNRNIEYALGMVWDNIGAIILMMFMYIACSLGPACTFREDSENVNEDIRNGFKRLRTAYSSPNEKLPPREKRFMLFSLMNQGLMASIGSIYIIGSIITGILYTIYNLIFVVPISIVSYGGKLFVRRDTLFPLIIIAILIAVGTSSNIIYYIIGILIMIILLAYVVACWIAFIKNVFIRSFMD